MPDDREPGSRRTPTTPDETTPPWTTPSAAGSAGSHPSRTATNPQTETSTACHRIEFRRAVTLSLMTVALPGSAQLVTGNKRIGRLAIRIWLAGLATALVLVALGLFWRTGLFALATTPLVLGLGRWLLVAMAVGWVALLLDAWRLGRPLDLRRGHRLQMTGLNALLCASTAGVTLFSAHLLAVQSGFVTAVFAAETSVEPSDGRYNVLLLGGDSGEDRVGLRPDSLTLASIDAETGRTVLIGLPRNLERVPFPDGSVMAAAFPDGFDCEECYLNSVHTWASDHARRFDVDRPGIPATVGAVEEITGMEVAYHAMVSMDGFSRLVDAVGGVTVPVRERTAIGGIGSPISGWIEPGRRRLGGTEALWYARSRVMNDDFSRMGRQKCLLNAMVRELDPQTVLLNVEKIAASGRALLRTDIPRQDLDVFLDLALKARSETLSSVSLVPPAVDTSDPDYEEVRRMVADAIEKAEQEDEKTSEADTGGDRAGDRAGDPRPDRRRAVDPRRANRSHDLSATC